jgi:hypothetical protein
LKLGPLTLDQPWQCLVSTTQKGQLNFATADIRLLRFLRVFEKVSQYASL